jgi:hypothetical protein
MKPLLVSLSCPLANHNGYLSGQEGNVASWHIASVRCDAPIRSLSGQSRRAGTFATLSACPLCLQ